MQTFIKLLKVALAVAVINAAARAGMATWKNVELKDAAQRMVLFGRERPAAELTAGVLAKAAELKLPVTEDQVNVTTQEVRTIIAVSYENPVEVFPSYVYRMKFQFEVEGFNAVR
jgi:hypothetical protein